MGLGGAPPVVKGMNDQQKAFQAGQGEAAKTPGNNSEVQGPSTGVGKNAAPPPQYGTAAEDQEHSAQANTAQQTAANRPDINTDFGSQGWQQGPDGQWTMHSALNPQLQGAAGSLSQQMAQNSATPMMTGEDARNQAISGAYNQAASRLNPQWQQQGEQLDANLANQGLDPNSQAYRQAQQQFGQQRNDAYTSAMNSAIGQGTAAQQATFGENMAARQMPLEQLQGLQGLGNNMPHFNAAGMTDPTQYLAAAMAQGNYGLGAGSMAAQSNASAMQGAGTALAAGAALASDERLKKNIQRLPVEAMPGVPLALFEFKHEPGHQRLGVIAQDVEKVAPQHVEQGPDGIKRVNYAALKPFSFG